MYGFFKRLLILAISSSSRFKTSQIIFLNFANFKDVLIDFKKKTTRRFYFFFFNLKIILEIKTIKKLN